MIQTPDICIYHNPCPDGFMAATIVNKRFDNVTFIGAKHGDAPPVDAVADKHVLLVDFSYGLSDILRLKHAAKSVTILDHHKSARDALMPLLKDDTILGEFDMGRSGAGLAWDACFPMHPRPRMVNHVEDRDLWTWCLENSRAFCAYLDIVSMDFDEWWHTLTSAENRTDYQDMLKSGEALCRQQKVHIDRLMKELRWLQLDEFLVPTVNANYVFASDLGNRLVNLPGAPFGATYYDDAEGWRNVSLRSTDDKYDVALIAVRHGGGGHRNSSGFRIKTTDKGILV